MDNSKKVNELDEGFRELAEGEAGYAVDYNSLTDLDKEQIAELMREPVRSIHTCISKGQLQTLCKQLLAQNLTLQTQKRNLEKEVAQLKYRLEH